MTFITLLSSNMEASIVTSIFQIAAILVTKLAISIGVMTPSAMAVVNHCRMKVAVLSALIKCFISRHPCPVR